MYKNDIDKDTKEYLFNHDTYTMGELLREYSVPKGKRYSAKRYFEELLKVKSTLASLATMLEKYSTCPVTRILAGVILIKYDYIENVRTSVRWV